LSVWCSAGSIRSYLHVYVSERCSRPQSGALLEDLRRPRLPPRRIVLDDLELRAPRLEHRFELPHARSERRVALLDLAQPGLEHRRLAGMGLALFA
jgi:hypothetical protein